jgi:hypothetical protein
MFREKKQIRSFFLSGKTNKNQIKLTVLIVLFLLDRAFEDFQTAHARSQAKDVHSSNLQIANQIRHRNNKK